MAERPLVPQVNLQTQRAHRRQTFWQVYFPLFLGVAFMGVLLTLLLGGGAGTLERGAQISVILLAVPVLLGGIVLALFVVLFIVVTGRAMRWLPPRAARVQKAAREVTARTQKAAKSIRRAASALTRIEATIDRLFGRG